MLGATPMGATPGFVMQTPGAVGADKGGDHAGTLLDMMDGEGGELTPEDEQVLAELGDQESAEIAMKRQVLMHIFTAKNAKFGKDRCVRTAVVSRRTLSRARCRP